MGSNKDSFVGPNIKMSTANKRLGYILAAFLLVILLGWYFSRIFVYVALSIVLSTILRPLTNRIYQTQIAGVSVPRFLAVFASFAVLIGVISILVLLFIPLISEQLRILSAIDLNILLENFVNPVRSVETFLIENRITNESPGFLIDRMQNSLITFIDKIDFSELLNSTFSFAGSLFIGIMAIVFITFVLLYEQGIIRNQIIALMPNHYFEVAISAFYKIEKLLSNYLLGLLLQMFSIFSIASLGLSILGVKYALTIAVFAAVANVIPYLGPILGAVFGVIVGLSTTSSLEHINAYYLLIAKILTVFSIVQLTDNLVLQPVIFSKSVRAHPLEIFIIIFAGATLAGIPGMIVAIPGYTIIRVTAIELYGGFKRYRIFKS